MQERTRKVIVVLPLVPVTARFVSRAPGLPWAAWASRPAAIAGFSTGMSTACPPDRTGPGWSGPAADDVLRSAGNGLADEVVPVAVGASESRRRHRPCRTRRESIRTAAAAPEETNASNSFNVMSQHPVRDCADSPSLCKSAILRGIASWCNRQESRAVPTSLSARPAICDEKRAAGTYNGRADREDQTHGTRGSNGTMLDACSGVEGISR